MVPVGVPETTRVFAVVGVLVGIGVFVEPGETTGVAVKFWVLVKAGVLVITIVPFEVVVMVN